MLKIPGHLTSTNSPLLRNERSVGTSEDIAKRGRQLVNRSRLEVYKASRLGGACRQIGRIEILEFSEPAEIISTVFCTIRIYIQSYKVLQGKKIG